MIMVVNSSGRLALPPATGDSFVDETVGKQPDLAAEAAIRRVPKPDLPWMITAKEPAMNATPTMSTPFPATGTAFVAGGSGGIGGAIVRALVAQGSDVVLTYRNNAASAEALVEELSSTGRKVRAVQLDLRDARAATTAIDAAAAEASGLHTAVYAVGPFVPLKFISKMTPEEVSRFLTDDTMAAFHLIHAALPHLREARGSLVGITTCAAERWANQDGLSAIPKAAVNAMFRGIAREEGRKGVRANLVALGIIDVGMFHQSIAQGDIDQTYLEAMRRNVPLQRFGRAEEVAEAVAFLASSKAAYTTGQTLLVDGGFTV